jgi:hypothetical protein
VRVLVSCPFYGIGENAMYMSIFGVKDLSLLELDEEDNDVIPGSLPLNLKN